MRKLPLWLVVALFWSSLSFGQELSFVPPGTLVASTEVDSSTWSRTYRKRQATEPNGVQELRQNGVGQAKLSGDLSYTKAQQITNLLYGLSTNLNLGVSLSTVSFQRTSSLKNLDLGNPKATDYLNRLGSKTVSGMGDTEVLLNYRHHYDDYGLLLSGLFVQEPTGKTEYDQQISRPLNLGTGLRRYGYRMTYDGFFSGSYLYIHSNLELSFDTKGLAKNSTGKTVTLKGGTTNLLSSEALQQIGWLYYGIGARFISRPNHKLGGKSINDGQLGTQTWIRLGLGNMYRLEQGPVALPWTFSFLVLHGASGTNLPMASGIKARLSLYF